MNDTAFIVKVGSELSIYEKALYEKPNRKNGGGPVVAAPRIHNRGHRGEINGRVSSTTL